jgi:hypothetical protein
VRRWRCDAIRLDAAIRHAISVAPDDFGGIFGGEAWLDASGKTEKFPRNQ